MPDAIDIISESIRHGAKAFLKQHFKFSALFTLGIIIIFSLIALFSPFHSHLLSLKLLVGSTVSALFGAAMMRFSLRAIPRVTRAVFDSEWAGFREGIRMGVLNVVLMTSTGILSLGLISVMAHTLGDYNPFQMASLFSGFAFGTSIQALWARLSGGFFKAATDIASDWTSKTEFDLPEDDLRNPAMIADQVGDHVGNNFALGINWYEKWIYTLVGLATFTSLIFPLHSTGLISTDLVPLIYVVLLGTGASLISILVGLALFPKRSLALWTTLVVGFNLVLTLGLMHFFTLHLPDNLRYSVEIGVALNTLLMAISLHLFHLKGRFVGYLSQLRFEGVMVHVLGHFGAGFVGLLPLALPLVICSLVVVKLNEGSVLSGVLGLGYMALGFVSSGAIMMILSSPTPLWDNACAIAHITQQPSEVLERAHYLDGLGKVFSGMGKIINNITSFLGLFIFLISYLFIFRQWILMVPALALHNPIVNTPSFHYENFVQAFSLFMQNPKGLIGLLVGSTTPLVFTGIFIFCFIQTLKITQTEVRYQFSMIAGIATGETLPDYGNLVVLALKAAQKWTIFPVILSMMIPILLSIVLGVQGAIGYVTGVACSGFVLSTAYILIGTLMNGSKKLVQSQAHDTDTSDYISLVTADALGDVFKDCLGPSLGILIRMITTVAAMVCALTLLFEWI